MFERFTDRARKVMALANQEAQRMNHEYIGTEHILLGLIKEKGGVGATILKKMGLNLNKARSKVEKLVPSGPDMVITGKLPQTPRAKKVIKYALGSSQSFNKTQIYTDDLLIGLLCEKEGIACQILNDCGVNLKDIQVKVKSLLVIQKKKQKIKKVATKKNQRPVKCEFFERQEFIIQETGEPEIRKITPRGSMSDKEVKETIAKFLSDKEFVQATEFSIKPFRNLKTPLIITKITIWYKDRE